MCGMCDAVRRRQAAEAARRAAEDAWAEGYKAGLLFAVGDGEPCENPYAKEGR